MRPFLGKNSLYLYLAGGTGSDRCSAGLDPGPEYHTLRLDCLRFRSGRHPCLFCGPDVYPFGCVPHSSQHPLVSILSMLGGWGGVLPPHFGQKKSRRPFSDFLLGVPLCGRRVFSYKSSGQVDPMCVE